MFFYFNVGKYKLPSFHIEFLNLDCLVFQISSEKPILEFLNWAHNRPKCFQWNSYQSRSLFLKVFHGVKDLFPQPWQSFGGCWFKSWPVLSICLCSTPNHFNFTQSVSLVAVHVPFTFMYVATMCRHTFCLA